MALSDKATSVPRMHLFGTLFVVVATTLALGSLFSWQQVSDHRTSLSRLEAVLNANVEERLRAEMQSATNALEFSRSRTDAVLRQQLVEKVDLALQLAESIHARESARLPAAEVKRQIVEALRPLRFFDGRGYYFVDDMQGRFILLPTAPQYEGQLAPDNRDDTGHPIMQGLIEAARKPQGQGFSRYRWYRPDAPDTMADKLAYVRHFAPYDWLIGTGDYTYEWEDILQLEALERLRTIRFGRSGYVAVLDAEGRALLFPANREEEGKALESFEEARRAALHAIRSKAREGGGFVRYDWPDPDKNGAMAEKLALVSTWEPWGWTLVVTLFQDETTAALNAELARHEAGNTQRLVNLGYALAGALLVAFVASLLFSRWSRNLFRTYHDENQAQREALARQAEALRDSENKLNVILDTVEAHIYIKDTSFRYQYANHQVCALFGCTFKDIVGKDDHAFFDAATVEQIRDNDRKVLEGGERVAVEEVNRSRDGGPPRAFLSVKIPLRRENGEIVALCGVSTDITQRKAMEDEIRQLAFYDPLTHLPNRRLLGDRLQQALVASARSGEYCALLFIDLDNFKTLNDTLGHDKGDILLQQVAARLITCVREGDTVARLGGDEFVIMLSGLGEESAEAARRAKAVGEKVLAHLGQPFQVPGRTHFSTGSVGITVFEGRAHSADDLLKQADLAMYQAKASGRNTLRFFDPQMQAALNTRAALEADLRRGLAEEQFVLFYQVQIGRNGQPLGVEALLRWMHPEQGLQGPNSFIPVAEETGLIIAIGNWVLSAACRQLSLWQQDPLTAGLSIAVNVSARQFRQPEFVAHVLSAIDSHAIDGQHLKLELTESLLLDDVNDTIAKMTALKRRGVSFSLDDFGTGYSSLSYLKSLPIEQLKIDQSFVRDLLSDPNDAAIARAIITLADSLGLTVIAEGVETEAQRDFLAAQGCHAYQGYLFGRPVAVDQLCLVPKILSPASPSPGMM